MALGVGLGLTVEEAAETANLGRSAYYQRRERNPDFYEKWEAFATTLADKTIGLRISKLKVSENAEERIKSLFGRAFAITEKVVQKAEDAGDAITLEQALDVHKHITTWASKFVAQEQARLLKVSGGIVVGHVQLQDETVDAIEQLAAHMGGIPMIPGMINVKSEPAS